MDKVIGNIYVFWNNPFSGLTEKVNFYNLQSFPRFLIYGQPGLIAHGAHHLMPKLQQPRQEAHPDIAIRTGQ
jgi:hypothetical protein